ncbi:PhoH family protein [bacterium]|nr:PhoH family protein [bacterium]
MKHSTAQVIKLNFDDNNLARSLFGPHDNNLRSIEDRLGVDINVRGGHLHISGQKERIKLVENILNQLYTLLKKGYPILGRDIEQAIKLLSEDDNLKLGNLYLDSIFIPGKKKVIAPRSTGQAQYMRAILQNDLVFGLGPAGTGKTFLAMAMAVTSFLKGEVSRIILTRPAIEAGEKLGFLPGDLVEKIDPYLRPLYDALHDMLDSEKILKMLERGDIEVAPLAFMRGRTLADSFVILDEAQNTTREQMKMFLTRIGLGSKVVVTGDTTQIDLPREKMSGLSHAVNVLKDVEGIAFHFMNASDVTRHQLVGRIITAYEKSEQ